MVMARDIQGRDGRVIAVIGDGSIGAGMAFEGLNHAGDLDKNLIIVLNDNEMSISENVGALSNHFSKIISGKVYNRMRRDLETVLRNLPNGEKLVKAARKLEEGFKGLLTPGVVFEELNFKYYGPINGHNYDSLIDVLGNIRDIEGPILLHVYTRKGKGYEPAEQDPSRFHGTGPYDRDSGEMPASGGAPSYTSIAGKAVTELGSTRENLVAITAAMPDGTGLNHFRDAHPDRFFDVGIAEQHAVTFAAGLALEGMRPYVFMYSTFAQRAYDQIIHDVCIQNLPVVFCFDRAGIVGNDGETHNGVFDLAFLRSIPNMRIWSPRNEGELHGMLIAASQTDGPLSIRYPRGSGTGAALQDGTTDYERWETLHRGEQIAVLATGICVEPLREICERENISLVNARSIKPLDSSCLDELLESHQHLICFEENSLHGGFGSAVAQFLTGERSGRIRLDIQGVPDRFIEHGDQPGLRRRLGLDAESMRRSIMRIVQYYKENPTWDNALAK